MRLFLISAFFVIVILCTPAYSQTVNNPLESQVSSFMTGLQPETPNQAVDLWILGIKNRSGAVQYALLSPNLQKLTKKQYEEKGWVTGQSSPWVDNFRVEKVEKINDGNVIYSIAYDLKSSYKNFGTGHKLITLEKNPATSKRTWHITKIVTLYKQYEGVTPAETIIK